MVPSRRSFLAMLGLAPLAAPAMVAAASAPARAATVRFVGASTPFLGSARRVLIADEVDLYPGTYPKGDPLKLRDLSRLTYADFHHKRVTEHGSDHTMALCCPAFIDDAGGGP